MVERATRRNDFGGALASHWRPLRFLLACCLTWRPPFSSRIDDIVPRAIITRAEFAVEDEAKTEVARERVKEGVRAFYRHRPDPLVQLRASLNNKLFLVKAAESFQTLSDDQLAALN